MMELSSGTTTATMVGGGGVGLSSSNNNKTNNTCPSDGTTVTSPNHHFIKRINEPSKGQQPQQTHNLLQAHIDHHQHQQDIDGLPSASSVPSSPKPNQVSTVLLYGIPIVSLYIESQERLCLAQISNTLLKQFSYNEIHNRRVALGITCVQCTPVQLEILRRAGAMPVSSRRCGMITRREAERLCKSFLGDNAPPRLPDDFAFSVHHKCAWGCRGSFLPSRYNSSRAKCIKCSYCGLFFSPNKFIFHSHRIGPGDKYVQPDAANFNSWRRHMKLSGNPPEEITHAWEDVKAMFNGGTRKRLMTTANSSSSRTSGGSAAAAAAATAATTGSTSSSSSSSSSSIAAQSPKRLKESSPGRSGPVTPASIGQFPLRPLNIHQHHAGGNGASSATNQIATMPGGTPSTEITLPFSRNFMMDYMWHAHAQNKAANSHFHFPNCTLPWIKGSAGSFIFGSAANSNEPAVTTSPTQDQTLTSSTNPETNRSNTSPTGSLERFGSPPHNYPTAAALPEVKALSGFYNNSAFKPVIQVNRSASSYSAATTTIALETVAAVAAAAAAAATSYDNEQKTLSRTSTANSISPAPPATPLIKESFSSDDEMVDIETTEEEEKPFDQQQQRMKLMRKDDNNEIRHHQDSDSLLMDAPIEVDNSSDELTWKGLMKKEQTSHHIENCRMQTPTSSLLSHSPASSINSEHHISYQLANKSTSSTPEVILSGSPGPGTTNLEQRPNCSPEQQRNVAAALASAFSHHRHHHHHHHHLHQQQQQQSSQSQLAPPMPTTAAAVIAANRSTSLSPSRSSSLVSGSLTADITNTGSSMLFGPISSSSNAKNNCAFLTNNGSNNNSIVINGGGPTVPPPCVNNEFWSVARLSFNRPPNEYNSHHRLPITAAFHRHHHDITKHFQAFRHHGHETPTQTNGVG